MTNAAQKRKRIPKDQDQLSLLLPKDLMKRINTVAEALGQTQREFVIETLDARTRPHIADINKILEYEKRIADREKNELK